MSSLPKGIPVRPYMFDTYGRGMTSKQSSDEDADERTRITRGDATEAGTAPRSRALKPLHIFSRRPRRQREA